MFDMDVARTIPDQNFDKNISCQKNYMMTI